MGNISMFQIIICEKPSQAQNLRKALGSAYGEIYPMAGHLIGFKMPEEIDERLKEWGYDLIEPKEKKSLGKGKFLKPIKDALKNADNVILATDCDREGTLLGREILDFLGYKGKAERAIFMAEDEKTLKESFKNLKPLSTTDNEYSAAKAREIADYILGLTMTRGVTKSLGQFIAIGRVKTPTFAIVTKRELDIINFKQREYYGLELDLEKIKLNYLPDPAVFNPTIYADILNSRPKICLLKKEIKKGKQSPPKPLDLLALTKLLSDYSAKKVLEIVQSLYEKHKIATYPRSESRYLPLNMLESSKKLFITVASLYGIPVADPKIRKGKSGVFFDNNASHHAIIPNINSNIVGIYPNLNKEEKRTFDLIAKYFLASLSDAAEYKKTTYSSQVKGYLFKKSGKIITYPGYLSILGKGKDNMSDSLPDLEDGEYNIVNIIQTNHITKPPARFTEATLADAMKNAWQFVENPKYQDQLKETSGIGTQATRANIIESLKKQNILTIEKKNIIPTDKAIELYKIILDILPQLLDPAITATWELTLSMIEEGKITLDQFINRVKKRTLEYLDIAKSNKITLQRSPSKKQISLVKKLAQQHILSLPNLDSFEDTKNFIDKVFLDIKEGRLQGVFLPSKKQLDFAKKLAEINKVKIPAKAMKDRKLLSGFIEENKNKKR